MPHQQLSAKGRRHSQQIIDGALRCLARDGYAATSIQRVADEAGLGKRTVLYYFETREQLFDQVGRQLGDRLLEQLQDAVAGFEDPADIIAHGFERLWEGVTTDRALQVAWLGLMTESITNPALRETTRYVESRYREVIGTLIDEALERGRVLLIRRESLDVIILAGLQGLILEYLANGETPQLQSAIEDFCGWLNSISLPPAGSVAPG